MSEDYEYVGGELGLFARAINWKRYFASQLKPHIRGDVAEVGAGIGGTTALLGALPHRSWLCLEPDASLAAQLRARVDRGELPITPAVETGVLADLPRDRSFDTILYIDVLEHIEGDRAELAVAAARLRPGGRIIVLCPAHNWLFSEFDRALGHFRRYNRRTLEALCPEDLSVVEGFYLDSLGVALSLGAKLTRRPAPSAQQIAFWDKAIIPLSTKVDAVLGRRTGKTVIVVFGRPGPS